jgi:hypothetical protein
MKNSLSFTSAMRGGLEIFAGYPHGALYWATRLPASQQCSTRPIYCFDLPSAKQAKPDVHSIESDIYGHQPVAMFAHCKLLGIASPMVAPVAKNKGGRSIKTNQATVARDLRLAKSYSAIWGKVTVNPGWKSEQADYAYIPMAPLNEALEHHECGDLIKPRVKPVLMCDGTYEDEILYPVSISKTTTPWLQPLFFGEVGPGRPINTSPRYGLDRLARHGGLKLEQQPKPAGSHVIKRSFARYIATTPTTTSQRVASYTLDSQDLFQVLPLMASGKPVSHGKECNSQALAAWLHEHPDHSGYAKQLAHSRRCVSMETARVVMSLVVDMNKPIPQPRAYNGAVGWIASGSFMCQAEAKQLPKNADSKVGPNHSRSTKFKHGVVPVSPIAGGTPLEVRLRHRASLLEFKQ